MERITSHQVVGLMEAYAAVHTPQINEEQVWEEVETWVNSLVEEGYDLSDYTWEEMYEHYLSEAIGQPGSAGMVNWQDKNSSQVRSGYKSSSDGKLYKNYNDAKAAKNSRMGVLGIQQGIERTFRAGGGNAAVAGTPTRPAQTPLAVMGQGATNLQRQQRPPAPAPAPARPAATAPARPAAPAAAATRPAAPAAAAARPSAPAPAAARPAAATTGNPPLRPPALPPVPGRESLASQAAELRAMQAASRQRQGLTQSFDVFDVIKGHLIDEGYADTEEAALQIMANMSEEWRESIVEEVLDERNRGERGMIDLQVRRRRDRRDGDTTSGATYVRAGGSQRSDHENSRGTKKVKGRVSASMRGPNDNVSNYHASSEEN